MNTTIQKWGNSLAVRLPKDVAEDSALFEGSEVEVRGEKDTIVITPVRKKKGLKNLGKLLGNITISNTHKELDWGTRKGKEVW